MSSDAERPLDLVGTEGIRLSFGRAQIYLATPSCRYPYVLTHPAWACSSSLSMTFPSRWCASWNWKARKTALELPAQAERRGVLFVVVFVFLGIGKVRQGTTPSTALHAERFTADGVQCHNRN